MEMDGFLEGFLNNLSSTKKGSYLTGSALRKKRRRGRGLVSGDYAAEQPLSMEIPEDQSDVGMGMYGLGNGMGMYGLGRKKRKQGFDIGKYQRAISSGKSKEEAKRIGRK